MEGTAIPLLAKLGLEPSWILEAMFADAGRRTPPAWASLSAFHHLRTQAPQSHPAFGTALLQWQRISARYGGAAPCFAALAFLALQRSEPSSGYAARILELWCRTVPLPIDSGERASSLLTLPLPEAALVAEELALGAHQGGNPDEATLLRIASLEGGTFAEARALASLELLGRGQLKVDAVARQLVPPLFQGAGPVPPVSFRLAARSLKGGFVPSGEAVEQVAREIVSRASRVSAASALGTLASELLAGVPRLTAAEVLAFSESPDAVMPPSGASLPPAAEMAPLVAALPVERAELLASRFPSMAGLVEQSRSLPGLTARISRQLVAAPGGSEAVRELEASLRTSSSIPLERVVSWATSVPGLDWVIFASPSGPGRLLPSGLLTNGLRQWEPPPALAVAHPVEMVTAERLAWQGRVGVNRTPLNQVFREIHTLSHGEPARRKVIRFRRCPLSPGSLALLARRGWTPHISPLEVAPELFLGAETARLLVREGPGGLVFDGLEFLRSGKALALGDVGQRAFSEAWRDIDEAIALSTTEPSWIPSASRAELVRALVPRLAGRVGRVEKDHVALQQGHVPVRITLHNAKVTGEAGSESDARVRSRDLLPFEDDGGVAALLVGRLALLLEASGEKR